MDADGRHDLWVPGPNGFHRHLAGDARRAVAAAQPAPDVTQASQRWYDFSVQVTGHAGFLRCLAGRMENGQDGVSDPAMGGTALADAPSVG